MGRGWIHAVASDLRRHWRHFSVASIGIVIGIAALTFFLALGIQIRDLLLTQVFPENLIEVAPKSADLDLFAIRLNLGRDALDPSVLDDLAALDGVAAAYPKMRLTVPALASGGNALFGAGLQTEIVADGIDPRLVSESIGPVFSDRDPDNPLIPCAGDAQCGQDAYCASSWCRPYIPVLVSPYVIELYNGAFRRAYDLPKINPDALEGLTFEMNFGASTFKPASGPPVRERMRLVGVSRAAIPLGVTLPLEHVRRLNTTLDSAEAGERYHSIIIELAAREAMPEVVEAVEAMGLDIRDRGARRAALLTSVVMVVFGLVGLVLIVIATAHIMHVFYLVVIVRRREIGLFRAVGARRSDITRLLVSEGAALGLMAGVTGVLVARLAAIAADAFAAGRIPDFPFKPESFFAFSPWLVVSVLVLAVLACVVGALPPARRGAAGDPSDALAGR